MEQIIINGVNASGLIEIDPTQFAIIKSVGIDLPLDEVGTTDPIVTLSGSVTGAHSFHSDTELNLQFTPNEDIYITSSAFTADYTGVISYVIGGANKEVYRTTDTSEPGRYLHLGWSKRTGRGTTGDDWKPGRVASRY